jgi:hypothetical protein
MFIFPFPLLLDKFMFFLPYLHLVFFLERQKVLAPFSSPHADCGLVLLVCLKLHADYINMF